MNISRDFGPVDRSRVLYALTILMVIVAGLIWRSHLLPLPPFMTKYGGDALWALVVFCGFGFLFNRISTLHLALVSLCFAWAIEFLQLYHTPLLDSIRATRPGHLVLGSTFNWPDLPAYAIGIVLGAIAEHAFLNRISQRRS
ncbi:MAG: DUF2809 domain-containing protein [Verrucomicrobiota bacterium]